MIKIKKSINKLIKLIKLKNSNINTKNKNLKFGLDLTKKFIHIGHIYILRIIKILNIMLNKNINIIIGTHTAQMNNTKTNTKQKYISNKRLKSNIKNVIKKNKIFKNKTIKLFKNENWLNYFNLKKFKNLNTSKIKSKNTEYKNLGKITYPYQQSIDNFFINTFIEIGGKDQKKNILYNNRINNSNKIKKILFPILTTNFKKKMSKSKKNAIKIPVTFKKLKNLKYKYLKYISKFLPKIIKYKFKNKLIKILKYKNISFKKIILIYKIYITINGFKKTINNIKTQIKNLKKYIKLITKKKFIIINKVKSVKIYNINPFTIRIKNYINKIKKSNIKICLKKTKDT